MVSPRFCVVCLGGLHLTIKVANLGVFQSTKRMMWYGMPRLTEEQQRPKNWLALLHSEITAAIFIRVRCLASKPSPVGLNLVHSHHKRVGPKT